VQFQERQNNTTEQVEQYISQALALVRKLEPPDDLRGIVFAKAVDLYSGKQIIAEQVAPAGILAGIPR
jgi:hypothetical protein